MSVEIDDLLAAMTLEEKCAQLGGLWHTHLRDLHARLDMAIAAPLLQHGIGQLGAVAGQSKCVEDAVEAVNTLQQHLREHTRLGIPALVHEEALEGLLGPGATQFPQAIGMAATWDPDLVREVATVSGRHVRAMGAHLALSPVLDLARDPRWGRTEETLGEDPELVARLAVAFVQGMQSNGIDCCAKHFIAHGSPLAGLNHNEVVIGPRRLRDDDALPYRAVIHEAGLRVVMNAYHELDGLPCGGSVEILTDLLRGELGFTGVVVADYFAVDDLLNFHRVVEDAPAAATMALTAGLDVELPTYNFYRHLVDEVRSGRLDESVIDVSVRRVLEQKVRLGVFEAPPVSLDDVTSILDTPADRALARRAAASTMTLLANDGVLPLRPGTRVAVLGPSADSARRLFGDYSFAFKKAHLSNEAVEADDRDEILSAVRTPRQAVASRFHLVDDVSDAEVAIVFVGGVSGAMRHETSGEFLDASDLRLPPDQLALIEQTANTGIRTVVVLIGGRIHSLTEVVPHAAALMMAWLPGQEGADAIVDVLAGDVDAGGRLPVSFLRSVGQVGVYAAHRHGGGRSVVYDDYIDAPSTPLFSFGHGLSYTSWSYSDLDVRCGTTADEIQVAVTVTNTGARAGTDVVQVYARDEVASVGVPARRLVAFQRVHAGPGDATRVEFAVPAGRLGFHGRDLRFRVEPGAVTIVVADQSAAVVLTGEVAHPDPNHVPPFRTASITTTPGARP